jgi:hypothetical protein
MTPVEAYTLSLSDLAGSSPRNVHQLTCHKWGLIAGIGKEQILQDICANWGGGRQPTARELERAHAAAAKETGKPYDATVIPSRPRRRPVEVQNKITRKVFDRLAGEPLSSSELAALSPIDTGSPADVQRQQRNAELFLTTLFKPREHVFCGPQNGENSNVLPLEKWIERLRAGETQPQFIVNPLSGDWEPTADGKGKTRRGKNCVSSLRYTLFEIDKIDGGKVPLALQARFLWRRITEGWPIRAIIYSGSKSLHAIVQVDQVTMEDWEDNVKIGLFEKWKDMGADSSTWGPERQARLPGHREPERRLQSLLWLCPERWTYTADQHTVSDKKLSETKNPKPANPMCQIIDTQPKPAPPVDPEPFHDPDGFTRNQREKLNLVESVFGGKIIRIENPQETVTATATATATHTHTEQLRALADGLEAVVMQAMEEEPAGYDESVSSYIRWHSAIDRRRIV